MRRFLGDDGAAALSRAVESVEAVSSAEMVVAVRRQSGSYRHVDLGFGAACAAVTLAVLLFSPWPFSSLSILVDPLVVGALGTLTCARLPTLRRWLTTASGRRRRVHDAALATFVVKGVHHTTARTGLLAFVSLLEREVAVVADIGVQEAAPEEEWSLAVEALRRGMSSGDDAVALARRLSELARLLGPALPRQPDDVNELPDAPCTA